MGKLTIARLQVEFDAALCLGGTASNFGDLVFKAIWQINTRPRLSPSDWILDRLTQALNQTRDRVPSLAAFHVHLELYLGEDRIVDFLECRRKDSEHRRHRLRILPRHNLEQRVPLFVVCAFVHKGLTPPVALVYRARPLKDPAHA